MIPKDLHARFRVRIECRLEAQLRNANFLEESFDGPDEVTQTEIVIGHKSFHLVKFAQVCGIHGFVAKHAVDGKVASRLKASRLVGQFVEHLRRNGSSVCAQQILHGFVAFKVVPITNRPGTTRFMHSFDPFVILFGHLHCCGGMTDEKGVVRIAGGV